MAINIIIFGPPGAGKGTQSEAIRDALNLFHLSTGDMLREAIKNETETGKLARQYTETGRLVPDDVVIKIVEDKVATISQDKGLLFDGFPRTLAQAEALDAMLAKYDRPIHSVVCLDVPDEEIVNRLAGRRVCPKCNKVYHVAAKPPAVEGKCDDGCGDIIQRSDDNEAVIRQRLATYHGQTAPVMEYYGGKGLVRNIVGGTTPQATSEKIFELFR